MSAGYVGGLIAPEPSLSQDLNTRLAEIARDAAVVWEERKPLIEAWWDLCRKEEGEFDRADVARVPEPLNPYADRLFGFWEAAAELEATTREGVFAKAKIALLQCGHEFGSAHGPEFDHMDDGPRRAFETCRELVALSGGAA